MPRQWISTREAAEALQITVRVVRKNIKRGKYVVRTVYTGRGHGRGGMVYQIRLDSLPPEAQARYWQEHEGAQNTPGGIEGIQNGVDPEGGTVETLKDTKKQRVIAAQEVDRVKGKPGAGRAIKQLARKYGVSAKTLYRWHTQWVRAGRSSVAFQATPERGYYAWSQEAVMFFLRLMLNRNKMKIRQAWEMTKEEAKKKGWRVGSYPTAARIYAQVPEPVKTLAREGKREWQKKWMPKGRRDRLWYESNQEHTADHTQLNIMVDFGGHLARPWITAIMDVRSGCIMGFALSDIPSGDSIAEAARHAMLAKDPFTVTKEDRERVPGFAEFYEKYHQEHYNPLCGMPEKFYFDNGKDFISRRFWNGRGRWAPSDKKGVVNIKEIVEGGFARLGIELKNTTAYCPWAKGMIEGFFPWLKGEMQLLPGAWHNDDPRKQDREKAESDIKAGRVLTLPMLYTVVDSMILRWNNQRVKKYNKTRLEIWKEGLPEAGARVPGTLTLDFLLMRTEIRTVSAKGIQFRNDFYEHERLWELAGRKVEIRYDRMNPSEIYVYYPVGKRSRFVCTAKSALWMRHREDVEYRRRLQNRSHRYAKKYIEEVRAGAEVPDDMSYFALLTPTAPQNKEYPITQRIRTEYDPDIPDEDMIQEEVERAIGQTLEEILRKMGEKEA